MKVTCPMCDSKDVDSCDDVSKGTYQCQSCGYVINTAQEDDEES